MATSRYSGAQRMMGVVQALYLKLVAGAFGMWFEVIREHNMVTEQVCAQMLHLCVCSNATRTSTARDH